MEIKKIFETKFGSLRVVKVLMSAIYFFTLIGHSFIFYRYKNRIYFKWNEHHPFVFSWNKNKICFNRNLLKKKRRKNLSEDKLKLLKENQKKGLLLKLTTNKVGYFESGTIPPPTDIDISMEVKVQVID